MNRSTLKIVAATVVVMLSLGLVAAACSSDSEEGGGTTTTASSSGGGKSGGSGEDMYASSCSSCHGADAKGLPKLGKDLTTSAFLKGMSDDEAVAFVKVGRTASDPENTTGVAMPPKGGNPSLSDKDIAAIVTYLRTLQQ